MRCLLAALLVALLLPGCVNPAWTTMPPQGIPAQAMPAQPVAVFCDNPTFVPIADHRYVWETVIDVVDDYFPKIERQEPVRLIAGTLTEGRIDSYPQGSPTILEPWRRDSVGVRTRVENTLQSMRRRASLRVIPAEGGYWVEVVVIKELEDLARPEHATAGAATFRYDDSLVRVVNPITDRAVQAGWIPKGRDTLLEQRIVRHLQARFTTP